MTTSNKLNEKRREMKRVEPKYDESNGQQVVYSKVIYRDVSLFQVENEELLCDCCFVCKFVPDDETKDGAE
jgi:hypothetical protein